MGMRSCMKDTWCWKFVNTKPGKIIKFIVLLILDLIDVAVDWYFYAKVKLIEPGLVYGPPEDIYKWLIFAFCIVSTLTLLIETIQNADDLKTKKKFPFLTQSLSNFLTIVFEDIPLLTLNLMIALCRDGDVSIISLTKASLCIICVFVRFILMVLVYWIFDNKKTRFEFICDIISTFGLVIVAILSVVIQLLNNFPIDNKGLITIMNPENFDRYTFFSNKYFNNVGIYMKWPIEGNNSLELINDYRIWLTDINDLEIDKELYIQFESNIDLFNQNKKSKHNNYTICIIKSIIFKNCYQIFNEKYIIELDSNNNNLSNLNYGFNLKLIKRPPQNFKYLMGYIDYNIKIKNKNKKECYNNFDNTSINNDYLLIYAKYLFKKSFYINSSTTSNKFYFKYNEGVNHSSLFNLYYDLNIAKQIWKTGIIGCHTNGDKSPKLNKDLGILC